MASLTEHYGQPHQLALRRIADLMEAPTIRSHDIPAFKRFALRVRALVGMLDQYGERGHTELECGSHVTRLMSKLPQDLRAEFMRYVHPLRIRVPTLLNFADWLEFELKVQEYGGFLLTGGKEATCQRRERPKDAKSAKPTSVLHGTERPPNGTTMTETTPPATSPPNKVTPSCPYCPDAQHYLNQCADFSQLTTEQRSAWIKSNRRCWRCGRSHQAAQCRLKARCKTCKGRHLDALHDLNAKPAQAQEEKSCLLSAPATEVLYLDRKAGCSQVLLNVTKVVLRHGEKAMETFAILDDGSERTMLLQAAAKELNLQGEPEQVALRTVRQDLKVLQGMSVSFAISPASQPQRTFQIQGAFTSNQLGLAEHSQPVQMLQQRYKHLRGLPLQALDRVLAVLIGSDYPHLVTPIESVRLGPPGGPAAVKTRLGWTLQGPTSVVRQQLQSELCLNISMLSPSDQLHHHVEKLWQMDILPDTGVKRW